MVMLQRDNAVEGSAPAGVTVINPAGLRRAHVYKRVT